MTPTPCPICDQPGGFHDVDEEWSTDGHRAVVVPRHLVRLGNKAVRRERPAYRGRAA